MVRSDFETHYVTQMAPLPCWSHLPAEEYRQRCREMIAEIERETAALNARLGRSVLGMGRILSQDPHGKPRSTSKSPAPMVHAASKVAREIFLEAYEYSWRPTAARPEPFGQSTPQWSSSPRTRFRRLGRLC